MTNNTEIKVRLQTEAGPLAVVGTTKGVTQVYFDGPGSRRGGARGATSTASKADFTAAPQHIPDPVRRAVKQLERYLQGQSLEFDFAMDYDGTDFQKRVWSYLLTIPPGETRTYGEVASAIGNPKGARAVGGAVGRNPISVAIPCHRVVGADGKGGGYGGGMRAKNFLLQLESASRRSEETSLRRTT